VPAAPAPPPETEPRGEEPWITVGLAWDLRGVSLDAEGAAVVEGAGRHALAAGEQLAVTLEGGRAVARGLAGRVRWRAAASPGETLWVTPETGAAFRWNGRHWRGQFKIFINPRGKLTLATRLTLESYLAGVVPGEIGALAEDLLEAGRAQAIAARSYTLFYRGRRSAEGFDLYGTVEDQVYGPVEAERPLATRCVESTAGEVALSAGQPIRANYCSTCGGITADVWEAWPAAPSPYLVSHRDGGGAAGEGATRDYCAASPHYRWREEWPAAEFVADIARFGPGFGVPIPRGGPGRLVDVRVDARSRSGRVWRLRVETTAGELIVPAWSLRQVLRRPGNAAAILRSNLFKVDVRRDPRTGSALAVVVSGAGSGHGVGLCQTGALGMAREGRAAEDIIRHYYRGVEIRRLY
ncbi:MAG: SpoIID/LytB domain-containing protein, partial [Candidatus Eisenbacteria bacterium]